MGQLLEWFRDSGFATLIASVLSLAALLVSVLAWHTSRKTEKQLLEIETARERDRLSKARKASLTARLSREKRQMGGSGIQRIYFLVVENRGEAEARDIEMRLEGRPFREHLLARPSHQDVRRLGPGSSFQYDLKDDPRCNPVADLEMIWRDDSGEPGRYRTTLTFTL